MKFTNSSRRKILSALIMAPALNALALGTAYAQTDAPEAEEEASAGLADIIVTAERRETKLQETPIAVSVIGGDDLSTRNITSMTDLSAELPNVNINSQAGMTLIAIRGIGLQSTRPGDDSRVAFYVNEAYIPRPFEQSAALFDIERIEVARGPQGTLFGRNATGGAITVTTREPTWSPSGYLNVTAGNYSLLQAEGAISAPITNSLAVRFAGQVIDRGGFGENLFTGKDVNDFSVYSLRGTLQWEPRDDFTAKLIAHYSKEDDAAYVPHIFATVTPGAPMRGETFGGETVLGNERDVATDIDPSNVTETYGVTGKFDLDVSDSISMHTVFAYNYGEHFSIYDTDGTTSYLNTVFLTEISDAYSAETRFDGDFGRLRATVGLYWFYEDEFVENRAVLNSALVGGAFQPVQGVWSFATLKTDAYAAFAQGTFDVTDRLSLTLGVRYSNETRLLLNNSRQSDFSTPYPPLQPHNSAPGFPQNAKLKFDSIDPKVSLNYRFTDDIFAYASFTTGFKSGGYNYGTVADPTDPTNPDKIALFKPEDIKAYEVGIKTSWFDRALTLNVSAFHYDYTNIQTQVQFFTPVTSLQVLNAGGARSCGVEVELNAAPTRNLRIFGSASYLDAEYEEFMTGDGSRPSLGVLDLKGFTIPQSPEYSFNLGASYTIPMGEGDLILRGDYQRVGRTYHTVFNMKRDSQAAYGLANAFITYEQDRWSAGVWMRNITDEFVKQGLSLGSGLLGGGGGYSTGSIAPPRTYGATIGFKY